MMRPVLVAFIAALAACGQAPGTGEQSEVPEASQSAAAASDPCALIADTDAVFGRAVTASREPMPNMCQWRSADAAVTGSIIVHAGGETSASDAQRAYDSMLGTLTEFGETRPVPGLGDQAAATQPGSQVQIVFRKGGYAVNVGASSSDPSLSSAELADRIARAAADRL